MKSVWREEREGGRRISGGRDEVEAQWARDLRLRVVFKRVGVHKFFEISASSVDGRQCSSVRLRTATTFAAFGLPRWHSPVVSARSCFPPFSHGRAELSHENRTTMNTAALIVAISHPICIFPSVERERDRNPTICLHQTVVHPLGVNLIYKSQVGERSKGLDNRSAPPWPRRISRCEPSGLKSDKHIFSSKSIVEMASLHTPSRS